VSERALAHWARNQHGLVTTAQLTTILRPGQVRHRIDTGRLERVHTGVLRVTGAPETWEQGLLAATLASGTGAVASHRSAAHLWNLAGFWEAPPLEITTPSRRRTRLREVVVHDSEVLDGIHVDRRRRVPVTSVARTLCDLTACCWPYEVGRALDDALRRKLTSLRRVHAAFDDLTTRGRRRSTVMRELLNERGPRFHAGGSDPEVRMIHAVVAAGLPTPVQQYRIELNGKAYRLDGAFPAYRVGLEYEGFDFHISRTAFDHRYERDRAFRLAGWLLVYVTSRTTAARVATDTRLALESRGYPGPPNM